ncbi:hypothetical protein [Dokdonella sp.]|uniref:hypothetical protein n=1 Tax=Dokdonella sp. TaxID=2291710 RepID=UPI002F3ED051
MNLPGVLLAIAGVAAHGADPGSVRYVPEIVGRLAGVPAYPPTNVCLRHSGSESTQCAYTDMQGRFRIPSFGEVHPEPASEDEARPPVYADYWLELGTRTQAPRRLRPLGLVGEADAVLHLDCDLARAGSDPCDARGAG